MELVDWLARLTAGALAFAALVGGYFEIWYYGPAIRKQMAAKDIQIAEKAKQEEFWRSLCLDLMRGVNRMVEIQEVQVSHHPPLPQIGQGQSHQGQPSQLGPGPGRER